MKISKKLVLASFLAALAVTFASPLSTAYARHGADDGAGHNAGDDRGGHGHGKDDGGRHR